MRAKKVAFFFPAFSSQEATAPLCNSGRLNLLVPCRLSGPDHRVHDTSPFSEASSAPVINETMQMAVRLSSFILIKLSSWEARRSSGFPGNRLVMDICRKYPGADLDAQMLKAEVVTC
jgi:hypothetical protein